MTWVVVVVDAVERVYTGTFRAVVRDYAMLDGRPFTRLCDSGFHALATNRISHALRRRGVPAISEILTRIVQTLHAADIAISAVVAPGVRLLGAVTTVVGRGVRIGEGCTITHGVTLGATMVAGRHPLPTAGRNVCIGPRAKILGGIIIGDGAEIEANALVLADVPPNRRVSGVPARIQQTIGKAP